MIALSELAQAGRLAELRRRLEELGVVGVVDELERTDRLTRALAFRALPKDMAIEVFEDLDPALQRELLDGLREEVTSDLVDRLDPDDRAVLFDELPAKVARKLLAELSEAERAMTSILLGYPADSVGRRMSPEVFAVPVTATVDQALSMARRAESAETVYTVPVLDEGRLVVGVVSLRRLLVTDGDTSVAEVMSDPVVVRADTDAEEAAVMVREHGLVAIPVVDGEDRLLGVFTVDDAMRVLASEESEDLARTGAAEPLTRPYLTTSVLGLVRSRAAWLTVLLVGAGLTVSVLDHFQESLEEVVALALFVPLLIGTGGNAGAQAATTVVRAMALGHVRFADLPRVVGREVLTGAFLGATLATIGFVPATLIAGAQLALVLAITMVAVCTLATTAGSVTPMIARRLGVDPAVVSAPFITTFVDATGLIVYFLIAGAIIL